MTYTISTLYFEKSYFLTIVMQNNLRNIYLMPTKYIVQKSEGQNLCLFITSNSLIVSKKE